jgi:DNA polymerase III subunit delta'
MSFRDIAGHRRIVALLARSVARDSLPPSLIFAGPAGAGKRLTATAVAQALNCLQPITPDFDACGRCTACTRIARGVHPDVLVVEPGDMGSIRIEQIRDVIDRAAYRPFEGKRRVVVIDDADAMAAPAQNALLKTLEEPPSSSVFILVTARPDVLLPTVRSRCIRLWFAEGPAGETDEESRRVAQTVLTQAAATPDLRRRIDLWRDLLVNTGSGGASDRAQLAAHLHAMASLLRDVELLSTRADARGLANPDVQPAIDRLVPAYQGSRGVRAFAAVDTALEALERNAGVKTVADWLVLEI